MQIEKLDGQIKSTHLKWLADVDVASLNPRVFQRFIQLCMLASAKFSADPEIGLDRIYEQLGDKKLSMEKRELILNEDPASKTAKHVVNEVRAIFKKCLNVDKDLQEVLD